MSDAVFEIIDPSFNEIIIPGAELRMIAEGFGFTEGPVWFEQGESLVFSDIPCDAMYRWSEDTGCRICRRPSNHANGHTLDLQGRLITCEHGSRNVTRTERDGAVVVLASTYSGKKLNSPNDVVVKSDGTIWFTDPPYGILSDQSGFGAYIEQPANHVFRLDPGAEEPVAVAADLDMPNGLAFSPDESLLYIADSGDPHHIRRFDVLPDNTLAGGEVFAVIEAGVPDGIRVDESGRLFSTAADGVHVFNRNGVLLGKIKTQETAANCAFGGPEYRTLFITATSTVWAVDLATRGVSRASSP